MSAVFEGVVGKVGAFPDCRLEGISRQSLIGDWICIYADKRNSSFRDSRLLDLAKKASVNNTCVYLEYDSRVAYRHAILMRNGVVLEEFGADDELWVPIDDQGNPIREAQHVKTSDLDPAVEYETIADVFFLAVRKLNASGELYAAIIDLIES